MLNRIATAALATVFFASPAFATTTYYPLNHPAVQVGPSWECSVNGVQGTKVEHPSYPGGEACEIVTSIIVVNGGGVTAAELTELLSVPITHAVDHEDSEKITIWVDGPHAAEVVDQLQSVDFTIIEDHLL